tara:strand:+ start:151 stop:477 length:327 start_codon:yes stop_codon:yes gene_type:complete
LFDVVFPNSLLIVSPEVHVKHRHCVDVVVIPIIIISGSLIVAIIIIVGWPIIVNKYICIVTVSIETIIAIITSTIKRIIVRLIVILIKVIIVRGVLTKCATASKQQCS